MKQLIQLWIKDNVSIPFKNALQILNVNYKFWYIPQEFEKKYNINLSYQWSWHVKDAIQLSLLWILGILR